MRTGRFTSCPVGDGVLDADVGVGTVVKHKMFGDGTVIKMYDKKKYINVKFQKGEKRFIFPDAFVNGFLTL